MSDKPIVVSTKPLQLSGTVRGPIVVTPQEGDSGDTTPRLGYNQITYKVKLVANGKTFNMLLPPSIESKHPGRSNPLQLPGLQIKANINISKLKIPGFFPIYQNLGVESLTISMSGMFTGYDGVNTLAAANWENSVGIGQSNVEQGQDSFTSASELYDFAVNSKALVQVTIYTSDGSFIPKKSTSTTFRDNNSNISFKGYIKEFEQVYIRQDRNYYLLRFEIVDFGSAKCKAVVKSDKKKTETKTGTTSSNNSGPITADDRKYIDKQDIEQAEKIKALIDKKASIEEIRKEMNNFYNKSIKTRLLLYAETKGYSVDQDLTYLLKRYKEDAADRHVADSEVIKSEELLHYYRTLYSEGLQLCQRFNDSCVDVKSDAAKQEIENNKFINGNNTTSTTTPSIPPPPSVPTTRPNEIAHQQQQALEFDKRFGGRLSSVIKDPNYLFVSSNTIEWFYRNESNYNPSTDNFQFIGTDASGNPVFQYFVNKKYDGTRRGFVVTPPDPNLFNLFDETPIIRNIILPK